MFQEKQQSPNALMTCIQHFVRINSTPDCFIQFVKAENNRNGAQTHTHSYVGKGNRLYRFEHWTPGTEIFTKGDRRCQEHHTIKFAHPNRLAYRKFVIHWTSWIGQFAHNVRPPILAHLVRNEYSNHQIMPLQYRMHLLYLSMLTLRVLALTCI